jgi:translation initiation factor IF-1
MLKTPQIVPEATGIQTFPRAMFRVDLSIRRKVLAYISGKMRKHFIRIVPATRSRTNRTKALLGYSQRACSGFAPLFECQSHPSVAFFRHGFV